MARSGERYRTIDAIYRCQVSFRIRPSLCLGFSTRRVLSTHVRKPALQFGREIGLGCSDMNRSSSGFTPKPLIQCFWCRRDEPAFASHGHSRFGPALSDRDRLAQEPCDLLPTFIC
jgi:hypothetical protein